MRLDNTLLLIIVVIAVIAIAAALLLPKGGGGLFYTLGRGSGEGFASTEQGESLHLQVEVAAGGTSAKWLGATTATQTAYGVTPKNSQTGAKAGEISKDIVTASFTISVTDGLVHNRC